MLTKILKIWLMHEAVWMLQKFYLKKHYWCLGGDWWAFRLLRKHSLLPCIMAKLCRSAIVYTSPWTGFGAAIWCITCCCGSTGGTTLGDTAVGCDGWAPSGAYTCSGLVLVLPVVTWQVGSGKGRALCWTAPRLHLGRIQGGIEGGFRMKSALQMWKHF